MLAVAAHAQRQQISYVETTKYWYYVYDEAGKKIGGLSRSSLGGTQRVGQRLPRGQVLLLLPHLRCQG